MYHFVFTLFCIVLYLVLHTRLAYYLYINFSAKPTGSYDCDFSWCISATLTTVCFLSNCHKLIALVLQNLILEITLVI